MSKEKRLINANTLELANFTVTQESEYARGWNDALNTARINAPTVDAVEVPCKIGDIVWAIRSYKGHKHPQKGFVKEMYFLPDMTLHICVGHIARGEFGKTVFLTREEAETALEAQKGGEGNG